MTSKYTCTSILLLTTAIYIIELGFLFKLEHWHFYIIFIVGVHVCTYMNMYMLDTPYVIKSPQTSSIVVCIAFDSKPWK